MAADALQISVFPFFAEGGFSPAGDVLDLAVAAILVHPLGWHWEFLPGISAGIGRRPRAGSRFGAVLDSAVINVYRNWKQITVDTQEIPEEIASHHSLASQQRKNNSRSQPAIPNRSAAATCRWCSAKHPSDGQVLTANHTWPRRTAFFPNREYAQEKGDRCHRDAFERGGVIG